MYIEFKKGEKYASKGADISDDPNVFESCGYVLTDDDLVIDIDHLPKQAIRAMLTVFDIKTQVVWTDRGAHLYFKKPEDQKRAKNGVCKLGFEIEQLTAKNRPHGITIKRNGVLRTIENEGIREDVPHLFATSSKYKNLTGLEDGDGRNEKLYAHKMALKNCQDWYRILQFINQHVFSDALDGKEFDSLSRTEAMKDDSESPESRVAQELMTNRRITRWSGKLWFWSYDEKRYISDDDELKYVIAEKVPIKKATKVKEVYDWLMIACPRFQKDHVFKIKLKNGFLNKGKFYPVQLDDFTPYAINLEYDPDCKPVKGVDEYLAQLTSAEGYGKEDIKAYRDFLLEVLAYGLIVDPEKTRNLSRFFIFRGEGANGKGTLLQILRKIYGSENCTALSMSDMGDMHYIPSMIGKLLNLGDDIEDSPITKSQFKYVKNITSADAIEVRLLYSQSEQATIQTKLIFTSNNDIRTYDKGYALERRMCWMPMFNKIEKPDPDFISKMTTPEALKYWMHLIVKAYQRLYASGWTKGIIYEDYNNEYHRHNNLALMFIEETDDPNDPGKIFEGHTRSEILQMFEEWKKETSSEDDSRPLNKNQFDQIVWTKFQMGFARKKVNGEVKRVLIYQKNTQQSIKPRFKN